MQHTALLRLANDIGLFRELEADRRAMELGGLPIEAFYYEAWLSRKGRQRWL
jgi:hypothetical protein